MHPVFRHDDPGGAPDPGGPAGGHEEWLSELLSAQRNAEPEEERSLYCFVCGEVVTGVDQRVSIQEAHQHTFANPGGFSYEIGCFQEAEGCEEAGDFTCAFSWFSGYRWRYAFCGNCRVHLGWVYESQSACPERFFGLILDRLVATRQGFPSTS